MFDELKDTLLVKLQASRKKQLEGKVPNVPNASMMVFPTGRATLYVKVFCPDRKKRVRVSLGNPLDKPYYKVLADIDEIKNNSEEVPMTKRSNNSVNQLFAEYLCWARSNKTSFKDDEYKYSARIKSVLGNYLLSELTTKVLQNFIDAQHDLTSATKNRYISLLKRMLSLAVDWGYITVNPATPLKKLAEKNCGQKRILTRSELVQLEQVLDDCGNPLIADLVRLLLATGARLNEILTLTVHDVDLEQRLIRLNKTKTGKSRVLALSDYAFTVVNRLIKPNQYLLFPSKRKPNSPIVNPYKTLAKIRARMGFNQDWSFHACRTQFASLAANAGASIFEVSKSLGHASVKTTLERYSFVEVQTLRRVNELVGNILFN